MDSQLILTVAIVLISQQVIYHCSPLSVNGRGRSRAEDTQDRRWNAERPSATLDP